MMREMFKKLFESHYFCKITDFTFKQEFHSSPNVTKIFHLLSLTFFIDCTQAVPTKTNNAIYNTIIKFSLIIKTCTPDIVKKTKTISEQKEMPSSELT